MILECLPDRLKDTSQEIAVPKKSLHAATRLIHLKQYKLKVVQELQQAEHVVSKGTLCCTINEQWIFSKSQTGGDVGVQLPS
jgi:hypothetical protein